MNFLKKFISSDSNIKKISDSTFDHFDKDNSGQLEGAELEAALKMVTSKIPGVETMDVPDGAINSIMSQLDVDKSGTCSKAEFFEFAKKYLHMASKNPSTEVKEAA
eukprot:CFRG1079T1